jgi:protein-disulfide isomerase
MDVKATQTLTIAAVAGFVAGLGVYWAASHSKGGAPKGSFGGCFLSKSSDSQLLGTLDGKEISSDNLPADLQNTMLQANAEHHRRIGELVDEAAVRQIAAAAAGRPSAFSQLPPLKELVGDSITDDDVRKFYEINKNSFPKTSYEQVSTMLRRHLEQQKQNSFMQGKLLELRKDNRLKFALPLPCGPKAESDAPSSAFKSGKTDQNDLVFISDYQCGTCRYVKGSLDRLIEQNAGRIQMRQVLVPGKKGGSGEYLVRGAFCAQKGGDEQKFAMYHNNAYFSPVQYDTTGKVKDEANPRAIAIQTAKNSGLDMAAFETCLDSKEAEEFVATNMAYADKLKIAEAPAFFLNQRRLWLPPQLNLSDNLQRILDEDGKAAAPTAAPTAAATAAPAATGTPAQK